MHLYRYNDCAEFNINDVADVRCGYGLCSNCKELPFWAIDFVSKRSRLRVHWLCKFCDKAYSTCTLLSKKLQLHVQPIYQRDY